MVLEEHSGVMEGVPGPLRKYQRSRRDLNLHCGSPFEVPGSLHKGNTFQQARTVLKVFKKVPNDSRVLMNGIGYPLAS